MPQVQILYGSQFGYPYPYLWLNLPKAHRYTCTCDIHYLLPANKTTWTDVVVVFCPEWPKTAVAKALKAECIQSLKEWRLELKKLGKKMETISRKEVWSHVKWAYGIITKVKNAKDTAPTECGQ